MLPTKSFSVLLAEKLRCPLRHKVGSGAMSRATNASCQPAAHAPVVANDEQSPEHGALRQPVQRPHKPAEHGRHMRLESAESHWEPAHQLFMANAAAARPATMATSLTK